MAMRPFLAPVVDSPTCCVAQGVAISPPRFDHDFCLCEAVEDLAIEQVVAKRPVKALTIALLPQ